MWCHLQQPSQRILFLVRTDGFGTDCSWILPRGRLSRSTTLLSIWSRRITTITGTRIEGDIAACKEMTLLETAVGVSTIARPRAMIRSTTWRRTKMADIFRRGEKLIFQGKICFRRDRVWETEGQVTVKAVAIKLLTRGWQEARQIQQEYGEEQYVSGRHYDRRPMIYSWDGNLSHYMSFSQCCSIQKQLS